MCSCIWCSLTPLFQGEEGGSLGGRTGGWYTVRMFHSVTDLGFLTGWWYQLELPGLGGDSSANQRNTDLSTSAADQLQHEALESALRHEAIRSFGRESATERHRTSAIRWNDIFRRSSRLGLVQRRKFDAIHICNHLICDLNFFLIKFHLNWSM